MTEAYTARIAALRDEARASPDPRVTADLLDQAARLADVHQDVALGYEIRIELVRAADDASLPDRMLVAYSWCLARFDREPERFEIQDLYWMYKWILNDLPRWPQVPLAQIESVYRDAERRYSERGFSLRPIHQHRAIVLQRMGRLEEAGKAYQQWLEARRDSYADCPACEVSRSVQYLVDFARDEDAVEAAAPVLSGRAACKDEPAETCGRVLLPLVRLGRASAAIPHYLKAARAVSRNKARYWPAGALFTFLGLTGNFTRGLRLLESMLPIALKAPVTSNRFRFLLGVRLFLSQLTKTRSRPLRLRLPKSFPLQAAGDLHSLSDLVEWCDSELQPLAARFDARNGTDAFTAQMSAHLGLQAFATELPISGR